MKLVRAVCLGVAMVSAAVAGAQTIQAASTERDGQHDWDTFFGGWKMHLHRRVHPLANSNEWVDLESHDVTTKVWNGRANLDELEAEGPSGHIEGMTLRLYDAANHQWRIYWANSATPTIEQPMVGKYENGRGEFYDQELFHGKAIYVRYIWSNVSDHSGDFEQAFSVDGGKTWEPNWITTMEREEAKPLSVTVPDTPGQHDFDFEFGRWKAHLRRLAHPLSGSKDWIEYDGTSVVRKVWNGRANLGEFEVKGDKGNILGLSMRLFDPQSHLWRIYWANASDGILGPEPMVGEFKNGRGEFYDHEIIDGKAVFVRFVFSGITQNAFRLEQAFSPDGGKTWEANWVVDFERET